MDPPVVTVKVGAVLSTVTGIETLGTTSVLSTLSVPTATTRYELSGGWLVQETDQLGPVVDEPISVHGVLDVQLPLRPEQ